MQEYSKKTLIAALVCGLGLMGSLYSTQTIFSDSREEIIKEFGSEQTKTGDDLFLSGSFYDAYQNYSDYLKNFIPSSFDEEVEAVKILWKRAYCLQYLDENEQSLSDFFFIEEIAKDAGYDPKEAVDENSNGLRAGSLSQFTNLIMLMSDPEEVDPEEPSKEEKWEAIRKGQRYLLDEGKEYVKEKWHKWKRRAKVAWKYLKQKHREYREQNSE